MAKGIRNISFNIYADSDEEAEIGRKAIIKFIDLMGKHGAMVSGDKIAEAVSRLGSSAFITGQIINFFKQQ
jgi:ribulose-5-phosphate 4-epimerase/fuculose-1-phosphate aldolase